ncbi:BofC C-terminal domain-containing protein [Neomoorella carbonis]|uniref:BofC C-terminal domain-containing protein n=1 Tax=Neomoorella carbonis TaxID=3062783 RepID=UPI0032562981
MGDASRRFIVIGLMIFLLGGLVAYQQARVSTGQRPVILRVPGLLEPRVLEEPRLEKYYRYCGHREPIPLPAGVKWNWAGKEEMSILFPPAEGWRITREGERLVITQEVDDLCPADAPRRHLAVKDGLVAIYQGPAGSLGPLMRVTNLKVASLPPSWREKIENGQAEFNSEQEVLEALDSLDEFRP